MVKEKITPKIVTTANLSFVGFYALDSYDGAA